MIQTQQSALLPTKHYETIKYGFRRRLLALLPPLLGDAKLREAMEGERSLGIVAFSRAIPSFTLVFLSSIVEI